MFSSLKSDRRLATLINPVQLQATTKGMVLLPQAAVDFQPLSHTWDVDANHHIHFSSSAWQKTLLLFNSEEDSFPSDQLAEPTFLLSAATPSLEFIQRDSQGKQAEWQQKQAVQPFSQEAAVTPSKGK